MQTSNSTSTLSGLSPQDNLPAVNPYSERDEPDQGQINVPPKSPGALWKVITTAIRCPVCSSTDTKANTGKRPSRQGLSEHYRSCETCGVRFRAVFE